MEELLKGYLSWICDQLDICGLQYEQLFLYLLDKPFSWGIERDVSRAEDGLSLRKRFCSDEEIDISEFEEKPCSVFEMLVALAIRMDKEWIGSPGEPNPGDCLFEMLDNLGLLVYDWHNYEHDKVVRVVDRWLNREFRKNGEGSIFPLKERRSKIRKDQRRITTWEQMMCYIKEYY